MKNLFILQLLQNQLLFYYLIFKLPYLTNYLDDFFNLEDID